MSTSFADGSSFFFERGFDDARVIAEDESEAVCEVFDGFEEEVDVKFLIFFADAFDAGGELGDLFGIEVIFEFLSNFLHIFREFDIELRASDFEGCEEAEFDDVASTLEEVEVWPHEEECLCRSEGDFLFGAAAKEILVDEEGAVIEISVGDTGGF